MCLRILGPPAKGQEQWASATLLNYSPVLLAAVPVVWHKQVYCRQHIALGVCVGGVPQRVFWDVLLILFSGTRCFSHHDNEMPFVVLHTLHAFATCEHHASQS